MSNIPFTLSKRKDSKFYYVRFKTESGKYLTAISTKQTERKQAEKTAWEWFRKGEVARGKSPETLEQKSIKSFIRKADITDSDLEYVLQELKRRGRIKAVIKAGSKSDIPAVQFMLDFWTWEKSEYIAEKLRKNHGIGKRHCNNQLCRIRNHWAEFLGNKTLGEITRADIRAFVNSVGNLNVSFSSKNDIIRAGTTALKWAYNNEVIESDLFSGLVFFSGKHNERTILTPEIVQAVFAVEWHDNRAKLANLLAMCTGLRAGEIQGLRLKDLGADRLYINHSWNFQDGLKSTKNGESRIVYLPFPEIVNALKRLAESNPFSSGLGSFVFWATLENKPMESSTWLYELRQALLKLGLSREESRKITFHGWRHYFTAYMHERVNQKMLQKQTGHKTLEMLEHYAGHEINGDVERLENAQIEVFGNVVNSTPALTFDLDLYRGYVRNKEVL